MNHQQIAQQILQDVHAPEHISVTNQSNTYKSEINSLVERATSARHVAFNETKNVANGADPNVSRCNCYMPGCKNKIRFSEFKDISSIKEFLLSGMCQKCQDGFFN
jgi:hypothetical protein